MEWHLSVLNAKSKPVPAIWRPRFERFLKKIGYRVVLREMSHAAEGHVSQPLMLRSHWDNIGVAPMYHAWPLAYRLRSSADRVVAQWTSHADVKQWLPGLSPQIVDELVVPETVLPGTYSIDVAILSEDGRSPHVDLAIEGKRMDRWYQVSSVTIQRSSQEKPASEWAGHLAGIWRVCGLDGTVTASGGLRSAFCSAESCPGTKLLLDDIQEFYFEYQCGARFNDGR